MKRSVRIACILMISYITVLGGCASPPIRSSYSNDIQPTIEGKYIEKVWIDKAILSSVQYTEVRLQNVQGVGIVDQTNITVAEAVQWLKEAIIEPGNDSIVLQSNNKGRMANLELVITELDPGSTSARFWAGEFGAGHAWVQIEGKLTDSENNKLLGYLSERSRKSGVLTFRNARGSDSGPGLIHDIIFDIAEKMKKEISLTLNI
jgi:hypothetical protein